jgi:hypothetical protein
MTLDQAVLAHSRYLNDDPERAKKEILEFLEFDTIEDVELSGDVRSHSCCLEFFRRTHHVGQSCRIQKTLRPARSTRSKIWRGT